MHLYELAIQYQQLAPLADGSSDIPAEAILDTLEAIEGDIKDKAYAIACIVKGLEAEAEAIQAAANAMTARAKRVQKRADNLAGYLLFQLEAVQSKPLVFTEFTVQIRENPEAVRINDDAQIPAEYMTVPETPEPQPDKKALKAALKAGAEIRGVWLERGRKLEIKQ